VLCATSCDDRAFLRENPETFYVKENIFSGSEQIQSALVSCYSRTKNIFIPWANGQDLNVWRYSKGDGTDVFDVANIRNGDRNNDYSILSSQSQIYRDTYSRFYNLISDANVTIELAEGDYEWPTAADKAYVLAQARFFRAFAYRNLGELFGGVPIVTVVETVPRYDYVRTTRQETYEFAIDEMEAILSDLPETHTEAGRIVKAAAQHNLCQLYLDLALIGVDAQTSYTKALQYANDVIDGGTYSLMTERFGTRATENPEFYYAQSAALATPDHSYSSAGYPIEGNVYWDLFQEGNQDYQSGNKEAIWVAQCDFAAWQSEGGSRDMLGLLYPQHFGPVVRDQGGEHYRGQYIDAGGYGIVRSMPTTYARDLVYEDKWGDDMRNSDAVFRRTVLGNVPASSMYGKPIPWDDLYDFEAPTAGGRYPWNDAKYTQLFPLSVKINPDKFQVQGNTLTKIYRDEYLIRLPETILLRAEIKHRMGNNDGAAADINLLRARAQCGYMVTAADVSIDLVLDERARELLYEESRWNTLLRMGGKFALERVEKYSYWKYPMVKSFDVWPIPQSVIDTNKDVVMEQNEGW
jgi:hypothetical protein